MTEPDTISADPDFDGLFAQVIDIPRFTFVARHYIR